jgi:O-antigen/teichoic acid export membrane protein
MEKENYRRTLIVAYLSTGLSQTFELAYNYLFFSFLSVQQIGLYSWVLALVLFFNVAVNMGIEPVLVRKFGKGEIPLMRTSQAILVLRLPVVLLGSTLATIFNKYGVINLSQYWVLLLVGAQVIFNTFDGVSKSWLQANHQQTAVNLINAVFSGLRLGFLGIMLAFSITSLYLLLSGILIIKIIGSIVYYFLAYSLSIRTEIASAADGTMINIAKDLMRTGLSIGGVNILGVVQNRMDWLLVSGFVSTLALASYSLANKLYEYIQILLGISLQTIYPWFCKNEEKERESLFILVRLVIIAGSAMGLCGLFISPALVKLFFADKFMEASLPVMILMLSVSLIASSAVYYHLALSRGLETKLFFITLGTTLLQFVSNLYLIPRFGITGAALGMLVLAITTLTGLTILMMSEKLLPYTIIRRVLIFLSVSLAFVLVFLYFQLIVWFSVPLVFLAVVGAGCISLFNNAERRYLIWAMNGFTPIVKITMKRVFSTSLFHKSLY